MFFTPDSPRKTEVSESKKMSPIDVIVQKMVN